MTAYYWFRRLHLWVSLVLALPLLIILLSGLLLLLEPVLQTGLRAPQALTPAAAQRLQQRMEVLQAEHSGCAVSYLGLSSSLIAQPRLYLRCADGFRTYELAADGSASPLSDGFFNWVLSLHRTLLLGEGGRQLVAISSVLLALSCLLGLLLWLVRGDRVQLSREHFLPQRLLSGKADGLRRWHALSGLYITPLLIVMVITGICWPWRAPLYSLLSAGQLDQPALKTVMAGPVATGMTADAVAAVPDLLALKSRAEALLPGYQLTGIVTPRPPAFNYQLRMVAREGLSLVPQHYLFLHPADLSLLQQVDIWPVPSSEPQASQSAGEQALTSLRFLQYGLHTGFVFGLPGVLLWALALLLTGGLLLAGGIVLWQRRRS